MGVRCENNWVCGGAVIMWNTKSYKVYITWASNVLNVLLFIQYKIVTDALKNKLTPMCQTSKVDWTWKHTEADCTKDCIRKIGKDRTPYYLNNVKTDEHGRPLGLSTLKRRKATRWGTDQAVIDFLDSEKKQGRGRGNILGISGSNYFDLFEHKSSTFTTADYPQVSCEDMPYLDNTFDYIICNQVLEHVSKPWLCVDEFHRVLKRYGYVIIVVPSIYQEHRGPKDNWRVLKDGMGVLLSEFSFREVGSFGNSELLKHMIDSPKDRYSTKMMKIALKAHFENQNSSRNNLYYTSVYGIGRK